MKKEQVPTCVRFWAQSPAQPLEHEKQLPILTRIQISDALGIWGASTLLPDVLKPLSLLPHSSQAQCS